MVVKRITMLKLDDAAVQKTLDAYQTLRETSTKDGKPYILSLKATKLYPDPRSQGFTLAAHAEFSSLEDMKFFDDADEAHEALRKVVGPLAGGPQNVMCIYWDA